MPRQTAGCKQQRASDFWLRTARPARFSGRKPANSLVLALAAQAPLVRGPNILTGHSDCLGEPQPKPREDVVCAPCMRSLLQFNSAADISRGSSDEKAISALDRQPLSQPHTVK